MKSHKIIAQGVFLLGDLEGLDGCCRASRLGLLYENDIMREK